MNSKTIIWIAFLVLLMSACNKPVDPIDELPTYLFTDPIINPPDNFQIYFNISSLGQRIAEVTFADSAVWVVEKFGNPRCTLLIGNLNDELVISSVDTLGLKGDKQYQVLVRNIYYTDYVNFFVVFKKLNLDYNSFPKKF